MRVILLQDIKSLGRRGDIKNVADGYARNFLLPRNLVKLATLAAIQELERQKVKLRERFEELKADIETIEKASAAEPLTFEVKVGEKGGVFGSVRAEDIKAKLIARYPELTATDFKVEVDHIKELGKQEIGIELKATPKGGLSGSDKIAGKITIEVQPGKPQQP